MDVDTLPGVNERGRNLLWRLIPPFLFHAVAVRRTVIFFFFGPDQQSDFSSRFPISMAARNPHKIVQLHKKLLNICHIFFILIHFC